MSQIPRQAVDRRLVGFSGHGYNKGKSIVVQILWFAVLNVIFVKWWCPPNIRPWLLRLFGAHVGARILIRHRVRVLWPWKLSVGSDVWIGEDAWLLNLEPIQIGNDVCVSQGAFLCTGQHDRFSPTFEYDNGPIVVDSHSWIGAQSLILRGVTIGHGATVAARACVSRDVPPRHIVRRNGRIESDAP